MMSVEALLRHTVVHRPCHQRPVPRSANVQDPKSLPLTILLHRRVAEQERHTLPIMRSSARLR